MLLPRFESVCLLFCIPSLVTVKDVSVVTKCPRSVIYRYVNRSYLLTSLMSTSISGCLPCHVITSCILLLLCTVFSLWQNKYDDDMKKSLLYMGNISSQDISKKMCL